MTVRHLTRSELEAGLDVIRKSPTDNGVVELIVSRPQPGAREVLDEAQLDPAVGLIDDSWARRHGAPDPATQLTVMNARAIALFAQDRARWPLAGDQLYIDLDLAHDNLPPGSRLEVGSAVIEVSAEPHTGCGQFVQRFGVEAMKFVNSPLGRQLHLRGINARVIRAGAVHVGDRAPEGNLRKMRVSTPLVAAATLLAILIAIYGPGIGKGFVKDDVVWVGANHVTSWSDVRALLFRTDGFYRPVVAATFALDRAVYGLAPFGFGVTNLTLLLLGACALAYVATSLGLRATTAVVVAGVWALNFHAVNMAVLWLSGRTALCVVIAAFLAAAALVRGKPIAAGLAALIAMLTKEEAVMLPFILSGWAWLLAGERTQSHARDVIRLTWPTWIALVVYFALRAQTAAMTPMTAPDAYRFVLSPVALTANALEYVDRACTFSVIVLIVAHLVAWRRPAMTPTIKRVLVLGAIWFAGTFALTIFVPTRSSLYALLPSAAPALLAGFLLQQLWDASQPVGHRRLVAAAVILPMLLLPVYWSRNSRWIEIAELSTETFGAIQRIAREHPDADRLVFRDDRSSRRSLANAYDQLLPEAVRLAAGREIRAEIDTGQTARRGDPRIVLENGRIRVD